MGEFTLGEAWIFNFCFKCDQKGGFVIRGVDG